MNIREELEGLEPVFHRPEHGTTRRDFERMTDRDFVECGASDFDHRELAKDVYLVTYTLAQGARITRRSTIWQRRADGWCALYHQGTLVAAS